MDRYIQLARQYFQQLEGLHLYPSPRSPWSWAWLISTVIWLATLVYFVTAKDKSHDGFYLILVPEVLWLLVTFKITALKEKRLVAAINTRMGASFTSAGECRSHVLSSVMGTPPSEFLKSAKEIDELLSLQRKFRKPSDLTASELAKNIYDRDSKARLLTLLIALVTMTVALSVRTDATLETVFEVFSEPSVRGFAMFVTLLVATAFLAFIGLRICVLAIIDGLASWSAKLLNTSIFSTWTLSYLVRDLVRYHGQALQQSSLKTLERTSDPVPGDAFPDAESNVVSIVSDRPDVRHGT